MLWLSLGYQSRPVIFCSDLRGLLGLDFVLCQYYWVTPPHSGLGCSLAVILPVYRLTEVSWRCCWAWEICAGDSVWKNLSTPSIKFKLKPLGDRKKVRGADFNLRSKWYRMFFLFGFLAQTRCLQHSSFDITLTRASRMKAKRYFNVCQTKEWILLHYSSLKELAGCFSNKYIFFKISLFLR